MRDERKQLEKPMLAYVLITISFFFGILVVNASGQSPRSQLPSANLDHAVVPGGQFPHVRRRWILGVRADVTDSGYLIRSVERNTAAKSVGLEPGDRIVTVNGIQIGLVGDRLVALSDMLEREGGHNGRVRLLVQDRRGGRLISLKVTLRHPNHHLGH